MWRKQTNESSCNFKGNLKPNCIQLYPKTEKMQI